MLSMDELYRAHANMIYRYLLALSGDVHTAEELTQEKAETYLAPLLEACRVPVTATAGRYGLQQTEEGYLADGEKILEYFASRGEYILRYTEELITLSGRPDLSSGEGEPVLESVPEE